MIDGPPCPRCGGRTWWVDVHADIAPRGPDTPPGIAVMVVDVVPGAIACMGCAATLDELTG